MKQKQQPAPLGPANYTGPSGDVSNEEARRLVQRYQAIKRQIYSKDKDDESTAQGR